MMPEQSDAANQYLAALRRRKWHLLGAMAVVFAVSAAVTLSLPAIYRSTATILVEQQEIPENLVTSTVSTYADQRIQFIGQRVLTRTNLTEILGRYELYPDASESTEEKLERMVEDIAIEKVSADVIDPRSGKPTQVTIAFTVAYENASPTLAQQVSADLVSLYLNENVRSRTEIATEAAGFIEREAKKLKKEITDLEEQLAQFKARHADSLPELVQLNVQLIDRTERELSEVERQLRSLEERRIYLGAELKKTAPQMPAYGENGRPMMTPSDRLELMRAEYLSMAAVYAPEHPDVVRLRRELAALEAELGRGAGSQAIEQQLAERRLELASARERSSDEHPDVRRLSSAVAQLEAQLRTPPPAAPVPRTSEQSQPSNPAYIELAARLEAANADMRAWRIKRAELTERIKSYEERVMRTPQVEREYRALLREHEAALAKYQEIEAKQMQAQLSESMEIERKGERFTLVEPPVTPEKPVKPNRIALLLLGAVLALAGGIGTAAAAESIDTTVRGRTGLGRVLGTSPLATIPEILTAGQRRSRKVWRFAGGVAAVGLVGIGLYLVHVFVAPVHVLLELITA